MTPIDVILALQDLDVHLWVEGNALAFSAPLGSLPADLRHAIAEHEAELKRFVGQTSGGPAAKAERAIERVPRDQPLPTSFAQERFWFLSQLEEDTSAYNIVFPLRLRGALDASALERGLTEIVRRHETLRTTIRLVDDQAVQVIAPPAPALLRRVDLSAHPDREAELTRRLSAESHRALDVTSGSLMRLVLYGLGPQDHLLLIVLHHMLVDRWSFEALFGELSQLYAAETSGSTCKLPELTVQYADYAAWQRSWYENDSAPVLDYWKQQLEGVATLELPLDRPRPPVQTFRGAVHRFELPASVTEKLEALGAEEGCTFFMTVLAAFDVLLARHSGQQDIVVGTPVGGRDRPELAPLIGLFVNMVALRTDLSGEPTFRELLARVRETALGGFQHKDAPFEQLVAELEPVRDQSRNPIFQVMFNLLGEDPALSLGDVEVELAGAEADHALLDLSLYLGHQKAGSHGHFEYNRDLFDQATVERMAQHFTRLLEEIARDPDRGIGDLPMLTDAERQHVLVAPNQTVRDYPRDRCYHQLFEAQVERTPDRVAVRCGDASLTYAELNASANQLAHHLRGLGAGPQTLVGVSVERTLDMPVALLGILKAGAAYVPLDPAYPDDRLSFIMADAGIELLVTQETLRSELPENLPQLVLLDTDAAAIAAQSRDDPAANGDSDSLAYVIFTSGSTGMPKGVQIEHRALVNFLTTMADRPGFVADDVLVAVTTISFDIAGLELYLPLLVGGHLVIAGGGTESDGEQLAALLDRSGATVMQATPATWRLLLETGWRGRPGMKALCGGEAMPRDLAEQLLPKCAELWNMYGPTETTIWSLVGRVKSGEGQVPIGSPIANTQIYLLDARHQPVPIGVSGELYLGGDGLARGYWNRPELTAEKFIAHPFEPGHRLYNTGDVARHRADGTIEFLGRVDHQVKIRGFRIELGEIEHVLARHDAVAECAVVVHEKGSGEKHLVAHLVFGEGQSAQPEELQAHLRESVPDYMVPPLFDVRDELPLTPNGKIDRKALMASEVTRLGAGEDYVPPRTASEKLVAAIWSEMLEVEQVGRNDNFFDLGGHSLLIVVLRRRLQEATGCEMSIAEAFQYPTLSGLAAFLDAGDEKPSFDAVRERIARRRAAGEDEAIAIVGMAGRFPGARDLEEYWANLRDGVESTRTFTEEELLASGVDRATFSDPNYVRSRAILDDIDLFDAAFFQVSAAEAEVMDPQQRLLLETAWQALENAGYDPLRCPGAVSVYAGAMPNTYLQNNLNRSRIFETAKGVQVFLNNYSGGFVATRLSYKLDLKGVSVEVQTACSTSLVAVSQACQALLGHQCEMAMAAAASVGAPQRVGYLYQEGMILAPDGHCRPFDEKGAGTFGGEGVGVVVLKRLSDALADGDHIRAVIRGVGTNNDGADKVGFTAPSVEGQAQAIASALLQGDIDPETIDYVEAHGTATQLGDPIEIAALKRVFEASTDKKSYCALGAVKSNFGHTDAAAGMAGLIKTVLALEHRQMPPTLHFDKPNPELGIEDSPFFVNAELREWPADDTPRRAGVSSFGFGGTNAHVVLEEAPAAPAPEPSPERHVLTISARTEAALDAASADLAQHLSAHPELDLADVAFTTQVSRGGQRRRRAVVCETTEQAVAALRGDQPLRVFTGTPGAEDPPVVFLFSGQGAQHPGMGRELYEAEAVFRQHVDRCAELLEPHLGLDLRTVLYPDDAGSDEASAQLSQTWLTQPALFAIEYALAQQWMHQGVRPAAMIGHSVGEFVAATLAGVFALEDALRLVAARGRMMQDLPAGDMLSVSLPEEKVLPWLDGEFGRGLSLAAVNSPAACVVSGPAEAVARLRAKLDEQDVPCRVLHTSHAFHSSMMEPIVEAFAALVREAGPQPAQLPCVSTVTGKWIEPDDWADPDYWARNLREPVRFSAGATELLTQDDRVFLEVGPGQTLSLLMRQHGREAARRTVLASMPHVREKVSGLEFALGSLARLWIAGVSVDWRAVQGGARRRRVPLPTYPFERQSYWVEPAVGASVELTLPLPAPKNEDVGAWFFEPSWKRTARPLPGVAKGCWLVFADDGGLGAALVERLERGARPVSVAAGAAFRRVAARRYEMRPGSREDHDRLLDELRGEGLVPDHIVHLWNVVGAADPLVDASTIARRQQRGFYDLMFMAQALGEQLPAKPVRIEVVTNDLHDVLGGEAVHPDRASVLGPARVIPLEYPDLTCRAVDLPLLGHGAMPRDEVLDLLVAEACSDGPEQVVAYRGRHRWLPTFDAVYMAEPAAPVPGIVGGGVYLITGGLGGIGLELAAHLAATARAKLVLTSRRGLPPREQWAAWLQEHGEGDAQSRRMRRVQALEEQGAEVMVAAADVADRTQMKAVVDGARARFGRIDGVVHAAGLATGGMIALRTPEAAAEVLDPKIAGTLVLMELLAEEKLAFFMLCSSINSFLGVVGGADYCGANAFLDALAHSKDLGAGFPFVSVDWDTWAEVGMAVDVELRGEQREQRQKDLESGIRSAEGVAAFDRILSHGSTQVVVSPRGLQRIEPPPAPAVDAAAEVSDGVVPTAPAAGGAHPRPDLSVEYVAPADDLERDLADVVQGVLGLDRVGVHDNFFELGFDSLIAHRMVARLRERLQMDVTVRVVLESPMVSELAKYLKVAQWAAGAGKGRSS